MAPVKLSLTKIAFEGIKMKGLGKELILSRQVGFFLILIMSHSQCSVCASVPECLSFARAVISSSPPLENQWQAPQNSKPRSHQCVVSQRLGIQRPQLGAISHTKESWPWNCWLPWWFCYPAKADLGSCMRRHPIFSGWICPNEPEFPIWR